MLTRHVPAEVYEVCQDKNIFLTNENQEKEGSKAEDLLQAWRKIYFLTKYP